MNSIKILAFALLFLTACQKDQNSLKPDESALTVKNYSDITQDALLQKTSEGLNLKMGSSKNTNSNQVTRPLKSTGSGNISYIPSGCGEGTFKFQSVGTGNSSHLGRQDQSTSFCINAATNEITSPIVGVGKAANGDILNYTFAGTGLDGESGLMYQDYIFTGGTGRFVNATGSVRLLYSVNEYTYYEYTGTGTITY